MADLHFVQNGHAVVGDNDFAERAYEHGVEALGPERPFNGRANRTNRRCVIAQCAVSVLRLRTVRFQLTHLYHRSIATVKSFVKCSSSLMTLA
ncbi:hypothetical protein D3C73_1348130 [compost metagenome]